MVIFKPTAWELVRTFYNHRYDDQNPVRHLPFSKRDLQVARLLDYVTTLSL